MNGIMGEDFIDFFVQPKDLIAAVTCVSIYLLIMAVTGQEPVSGTRQKTRTAADRLLSSGVDFWRQRRAHQGP
jgi:hypothetical protein